MAYKVGRCLLRKILHDLDMTQAELSDILDITEQQINKYVNDRQRMSLEVARNISYVCNCHIEDLYEWSRQ